MSINASVIFLLLTLTIIFASGKFVQIMVTIRSTLSQMVSMFKVRIKIPYFLQHMCQVKNKDTGTMSIIRKPDIGFSEQIN